MSKPHNPHEEAAGAPAAKEQNESSAKPARAADAAAAEPNSIDFRLHRPAQPTSGAANLKAGEKSAGEAQSKPKEEVTRGTLSLGGRHSERVPDSVLERFIKVGNNFYFRDGTEAFIDRGNKITTHSENMVVIQSMVAIARERAKGEVTVKGSEFFRKEAWFAARLAGLEVRGYEPTQLEQERLVRAIARRQEIARNESPLSPDVPLTESRHDRQTRPRTGSQDPARAAPADSELLVGHLVDHGPAPFDRNDKNPMNYYVRVETEHGDVERWGVDLERAFRHSLSTPGIGDKVGLRVVGQEMVTVRSPKYDAQGRKIGEEKLDTHRNRWIVERKDFLDRREKMAGVFRDAAIKAAQATQLYPELEGSYLQFQMGRSLAEQQYTNKDHREQFVNHMREYLAKIIESGKPLEPVPLRDRGDRTPKPEQVKDRDFTPTR